MGLELASMTYITEVWRKRSKFDKSASTFSNSSTLLTFDINNIKETIFGFHSPRKIHSKPSSIGY
jgi:hypothetical protein